MAILLWYPFGVLKPELDGMELCLQWTVKDCDLLTLYLQETSVKVP